MKIQKKIFILFFFWGGGRVGEGGRVGGVRVDVNSEVSFCENKKKWGGGDQVRGDVRGGGGHRVDVNKELKFL